MQGDTLMHPGRKGPSPLEPYAGELARAVLRGGELVGAIPSQ